MGIGAWWCVRNDYDLPPSSQNPGEQPTQNANGARGLLLDRFRGTAHEREPVLQLRVTQPSIMALIVLGASDNNRPRDARGFWLHLNHDRISIILLGASKSCLPVLLCPRAENTHNLYSKHCVETDTSDGTVACQRASQAYFRSSPPHLRQTRETRVGTPDSSSSGMGPLARLWRRNSWQVNQ